MTTNAATIKDTVANLLSAAGVTFSVQSAGETVRDGWKCDAWRVTLGTMTTEYYTGTGLRKALTKFQAPRPVAPVAADVLHSLLLDASACEMSFSDWAGDYGYSDDSIDALNVYRKCCAIGKDLRKVFDAKTRQAISDALQDY